MKHALAAKVKAGSWWPRHSASFLIETTSGQHDAGVVVAELVVPFRRVMT